MNDSVWARRLQRGSLGMSKYTDRHLCVTNFSDQASIMLFNGGRESLNINIHKARVELVLSRSGSGMVAIGSGAAPFFTIAEMVIDSI